MESYSNIYILFDLGRQLLISHPFHNSEYYAEEFIKNWPSIPTEEVCDYVMSFMDNISHTIQLYQKVNY